MLSLVFKIISLGLLGKKLVGHGLTGLLRFLGCFTNTVLVDCDTANASPQDLDGSR